MTISIPEIIGFLSVALAIGAVRFWISCRPDVARAHQAARTAALWFVTVLALVLSAAGLLYPSLRPTSAVGFFVALGAISLLAARQRNAPRTQDPTP